MTIPKTLLDLPHWVAYGPGKAPINVKTGAGADSTNMDSGTDHDSVVAYEVDNFDTVLGKGFILGDGIVGIDIDGAIDDAGNLRADAAEILAMMQPCYAEISPSKKGIHILGLGTKIAVRCKRGLDESKMLEIYDKDRYFTFTDDALPGSTADLTDLTGRLGLLCEKYFPGKASKVKEVAPISEEEIWTDEAVLAAARGAKNAFAFEDLWDGKFDNYPSQSEADASLLERLLFFNGKNLAQAERMFRESGLYRDKWDTADYRERTFKLVLGRMTDCRHKPRPLTEVGVAERLADQCGDQLRFCQTWSKWLLWGSDRHTVDKAKKVQSLTVKLMRTIESEVSTMKFEDDKQKAKVAAIYGKFAKSLERNVSISNVVKQAERLMSVNAEDLDSDPWLFNVQNGTLNLKTGKLQPHDPDDLITKISPAVFDPKATCPMFDEFLRTVLCGEAELVSFIKQAIGMTLSGSVREQCFFVLYGLGDNGKSVLLNIIRALMGDYGKTAPPNVFLEKSHGDGIPNDLADLAGTRYVADVETKERSHFNEQRIKAVTGGEPVKARFLHNEFFEFIPQLTLWIAGNHKPTITGTDKGMWRRMRMIGFNASIPDEKKIPDLDKVIVEKELSGILNFALAGCLEWLAAGKLITPPQVLITTEDYRKEMDILGCFIDECCDVGEDYSVLKEDLYQTYRRWAIAAGYQHPLAKVPFGTKMKDRRLYFERKRSDMGGKWFWSGLQLNESVTGL